MPHIDEGVLHAYLDGALDALAAEGALPDGVDASDVDAHLRACADCRALLERERDVRERAGIVMRDARLHTVDVPPFEMLAQSRTAARRRGWLPLAWAASLLLAVGAGWYGSAIFRSTSMMVATESAASLPEGAPAAPPAGAPADAVAAAAGPASVLADEAVHAQAERRAGDVARGVPGDHAAAGAAAASGVEPPLQVAAEAAPQPAVVAAAPPPPPAPAPAARAAPLQEVQGRQVERHAFRVDSSALQSIVVTGQRSTAIQGTAFAATDAYRLQAESVGSQDLLIRAFRANVQRARRGEFDWLALSRDDLSRSSTPALMIEGAGEPAVHAAAGAIPGRLVRVVQRLDSGVVVELIMLRVPAVRAEAADAVVAGLPPRIEQPPRLGAAPARLAVTQLAAEPLGGGQHEFVALLPELELFVALRAAVPETELAALAHRLVPLR